MIALAMWRTSFGGVNDFGARLGDRRLPVRARDPGARCSTSGASGGRSDGHARHRRARSARSSSSESAAREDRARLGEGAAPHRPRRRRRCSGSSRRSGSSSRRCSRPRTISEHGWWKVFSEPSLADLRELRRRSSTTTAITHCARDDALDRGRRHGPADHRRARSPATRSPGSSSRAATGSSSS